VKAHVHRRVHERPGRPREGYLTRSSEQWGEKEGPEEQ
jgi:hypothetical protein